MPPYFNEAYKVKLREKNAQLVTECFVCNAFWPCEYFTSVGWNSALSVHHNKICAAIDSEWNFWQSYKYCMQFGMACKMWVQFSGACVNMIFKLREDEKWECWKNCWMQAAAACKLTASALTPNFQLKKKMLIQF